MDDLAVAESVSALDLGFTWLSSFDSLRYNPDFPSSPFWSRLCRIWRLFHRVISRVGLGLDGNKPDHLDLIGGTVSLLGVGIMMYWPR